MFTKYENHQRSSTKKQVNDTPTCDRPTTDGSNSFQGITRSIHLLDQNKVAVTSTTTLPKIISKNKKIKFS